MTNWAERLVKTGMAEPPGFTAVAIGNQGFT
jgi:hypothetical protein